MVLQPNKKSVLITHIFFGVSFKFCPYFTSCNSYGNLSIRKTDCGFMQGWKDFTVFLESCCHCKFVRQLERKGSRNSLQCDTNKGETLFLEPLVVLIQ